VRLRGGRPRAQRPRRRGGGRLGACRCPPRAGHHGPRVRPATVRPRQARTYGASPSGRPRSRHEQDDVVGVRDGTQRAGELGRRVRAGQHDLADLRVDVVRASRELLRDADDRCVVPRADERDLQRRGGHGRARWRSPSTSSRTATRRSRGRPPAPGRSASGRAPRPGGRPPPLGVVAQQPTDPGQPSLPDDVLDIGVVGPAQQRPYGVQSVGRHQAGQGVGVLAGRAAEHEVQAVLGSDRPADLTGHPDAVGERHVELRLDEASHVRHAVGSAAQGRRSDPALARARERQPCLVGGVHLPARGVGHPAQAMAPQPVR
jgi:hypothetical protein